jgi:uncharacterized C2H2 Zn-finger protein
MDHPKQRHGNHTWDLVLHYDCCPKCGYVFENREKFERRFTVLEKELACPRCFHTYKMTKKPRAAFGPLLGNDPEIDE